MKKRAYIYIFMLIILLNITFINALEFDLYPKNNQDYQAILMGLIPLAILFAISYVLIKSRKNFSYLLQRFLWYVYFFYYIGTFIVWFHEYANLGFFPLELIRTLNHIPINEPNYLFFLAIIINSTIAFFMSFKNPKTIGYFIRR
ncbi:hypothetical protein GOV12_05940 [Candidatus Pacearchaeota archaeon]|nr:hypothetical protein [Candidatus Pacearchaeota archaeon]